jgi:hypothetical protein
VTIYPELSDASARQDSRATPKLPAKVFSKFLFLNHHFSPSHNLTKNPLTKRMKKQKWRSSSSCTGE